MPPGLFARRVCSLLGDANVGMLNGTARVDGGECCAVLCLCGQPFHALAQQPEVGPSAPPARSCVHISIMRGAGKKESSSIWIIYILLPTRTQKNRKHPERWATPPPPTIDRPHDASTSLALISTPAAARARRAAGAPPPPPCTFAARGPVAHQARR